MRILGPLVLAILAACSSSVAPRSGVTLLVTNQTCGAGGCDSLRIVAYPDRQPDTPGGPWMLDLGLVTTSQACLTIPASAKFLVIGADTTTIAWGNDQPMRIGALPPRTPLSEIARYTPSASFVPAAAAGWTISAPTLTRAVSASACRP